MSHLRAIDPLPLVANFTTCLSWLVRALVVGLVLQIASPVQAGALGVPDRPTDVLAAKAYDVLKRHCARCHQAGRNRKGAHSAGIDNILDLDALAREPGLIRPGRPDQSNIYLSMLTRRMPLDVLHTKRSGQAATIQEIKAVRGWIAGLRIASVQSCDGRRLIEREDTQASARVYLRNINAAQVKDTRFISLAHLFNACVTPQDMSQHRKGVRALFHALSFSKRTKLHIPSVDRQGALLAVNLNEIGWQSSDWEKLAGRQPLRYRVKDAAGIRPLAGDWLASDALRLAKLSNFFGKRRDRDNLAERLPEETAHWVYKLAGRFNRPLDLTAAAGELGQSGSQFLNRLNAYNGRHVALARRLRQGLVSRLEFERLAVDLTREASRRSDTAASSAAGLVPIAAAAQPLQPKLSKSEHRDALTRRPRKLSDPLAPIGLSVWTNKQTYSRGEDVRISAQTDTDCHLTIVNVDTTGLATVLFPNEFVRNNRIQAHSTVHIPHAGAAYLLKFNEPGREKLVAICMPDLRTPPGIKRNYDRRRFTILGDWEAFLDTSLKSEEQMRRRARGRAQTSGKKKRRKRRRRWRRRNGYEPETPYRNDGRPEPQTRRAITIAVE